MRILVAEDDLKVAAFLKSALESESYAVDIASTGSEALYMAETIDFDLIVLDLILPEIHGFDVLKSLRAKERNIPVLILTGMTRIEDRVKGIDLGADDYMTKPFAIREVLARVRALLRRGGRERGLILRVGDLEMDRLTRSVRRGPKRIELTAKEFALLEYLMRSAGRALTRDMIVEHVWDMSSDVWTNVVDVYINYLRNKVDRGFDRTLIHTVRGVGYRMSDSE